MANKAGHRTVVMVFAMSLRQLYLDGTNPANLPGPCHLDNFIMTQNLSSVYHIHKTGSGQFLQPGQLDLSAGFAKITPSWIS